MQLSIKGWQTQSGNRFQYHLEITGAVYDDERALFDKYQFWDFAIRTWAGPWPGDEPPSYYHNLTSADIFRGAALTDTHPERLMEVEQRVAASFEKVISIMRMREQYVDREFVLEVATPATEAAAET